MAPTLVNANRAEIPFANSNRTMGHHTFQRLMPPLIAFYTFNRSAGTKVTATRRVGVKVTL
jgi:hypothetical protein